MSNSGKYIVNIGDVEVRSERPIETKGLKQFKSSNIKPMKTKGLRVKSVRFERVNINKEAKNALKDGSTILITNPDGVNSDGTRTRDGIFAPYFGANMIKSDVTPYSCECGRTTSAMEEGNICPHCKTLVQYVTTNLKKNAYISIAPHKILTYHGYYLFMKFLNKKKMELVKSKSIRITGERILEENKIDMTEIYEFYKEHEEEIGLDASIAFTSYIVVINANLRPLIKEGDKLKQFPINKEYTLLLNAAQNLKVLKYNPNPNEVATLLYEIQECSNNINNILEESLASKNGDIRLQLTTCKMDWCSRMVITPGNGLKPDEVDIPYPTLVTFYEEELVKILIDLGYEKDKALDIFIKSQSEISSHMKRAIKVLLKNERWILINRNPTIKIGSILYMKIRGYNKDINDLTMKIPAAIRPLMNADHDGDQLTGVCNKLVSDSEYSFHNVFKYVFSPKYMFVDGATGYVNKSLMFTKDHATILSDLMNLGMKAHTILFDSDDSTHMLGDVETYDDNSYDHVIGELLNNNPFDTPTEEVDAVLDDLIEENMI